MRANMKALLSTTTALIVSCLARNTQAYVTPNIKGYSATKIAGNSRSPSLLWKQQQRQQRQPSLAILFSNQNSNSNPDENDDDGTTTTPTIPRPRGGELNRNKAFWLEWTSALPELADFEPTSFFEDWKAIRDNIIKGEWGTRGEVYVVLQFGLLAGITAGALPLLGLVRLILGPTLLVGGLVTCALSAARLGKALSPWPVPTDNSILYTDGFYAAVRHPIYSGLLAACLGLALVTESMYRLGFTALLYYVLHLKSNYEETALLEKYGVVYEDYQQAVPGKLVPQVLLDVLPPWSFSSTTSSKDESTTTN